jgi:hypothetical protein
MVVIIAIAETMNQSTLSDGGIADIILHRGSNVNLAVGPPNIMKEIFVTLGAVPDVIRTFAHGSVHIGPVFGDGPVVCSVPPALGTVSQKAQVSLPLNFSESLLNSPSHFLWVKPPPL